MSYENYENEKPHGYDAWEPGVYRTGSTRPPKNRRGITALLLMIVILLCGVISILGIMNVRLFRQLNADQRNETLPIMFSNPETTESTFPSSTMEIIIPGDTQDSQNPPQTVIGSEKSPVSQENIPQEGGLSLQEIYSKTISSVVSISCTYQNGTSSGTGVILSEDGYIVTNCHVVENAISIRVILTDDRIIEADLVGTDEATDLAVLHITADGLVPAVLGDSSMLRVGDTVVAIGDPLGIELRGTMTDGIISAINRDIEVGGRTMSLIQTNAALNSGNSGGPLINCYGQVIGINTMKIGDSVSIAGVEGLGFAIPSATVEEIVNQLIQQGYVSGRAEIGIIGESVSPFYQFYYHFPQGLYIIEVKEGSSADAVGITPGDILISIDSHPITTNEDLKSLMYSYKPGDVITALIYRGGHQYQVSITVGEANG